CAISLRGCPLISPSKITAVCVESQSCVSCGDDWKYQTILPVSALSATIDAVNRLAPARFLCAITGCGLPVVTYTRFSSGSYVTGCQVIPPPCFMASSFGHVSEPGSPIFCGTAHQRHCCSPVAGSCASR